MEAGIVFFYLAIKNDFTVGLAFFLPIFLAVTKFSKSPKDGTGQYKGRLSIAQT